MHLDANGQAAIAVSDIYDPANSSDNCGIDENSLVLDITSFGCSNIGTPVEVTLSGSDVNDNLSTVTATVTVMDKIAPTVNPPIDITVNNYPASCTAVIDLGQVAMNDNCTGVQLSNGGIHHGDSRG